MKPDLTALFDLPAFRADMLFFLRMAGAYVEAIFLDARHHWNPSRRKLYQATINDLLSQYADRKQFWANIRRAFPKGEFAFKKDFTLLLECLSPALRDNISRRLQWEHALPWTMKEFVFAIDLLREYRHALEHYQERQNSGRASLDHETVMRALGLLLLPHLQNHLVGRMRSAQRKLRIRGGGPAMALQPILRKALDDRRLTSQQINGLATRKTLPRSERLDREAYNHRWKERFPEWFAEDCWPRYNEHNFKIRYHFIGRTRLDLLKTEIQKASAASGYFGDPSRCDFMREIEPLYYATLDINLVLHKALACLEESGINVRSSNKAGKLVPALRNEIAHCGAFWSIRLKGSPEPIAVQSVFEEMLKLCDTAKEALPNLRNDLATAIERLLRDYAAARVHKVLPISENLNRAPPPLVIHRWTAERRTQFLDRADYRIDRRPRLRAVLASWQRDLRNAQRN